MMSHGNESSRLRLSAIMLIYGREIRDQLRDRRTLFTIMVLPVLLYPLIGSVLLQMAQLSNRPTLNVALIGSEQLATLPPLLVDSSPESHEQHRFADHLLGDGTAMRLSLFSSHECGGIDRIDQLTRRWIRDGVYDAVVHLQAPSADQASTPAGGKLQIQLWGNTASGTSQSALHAVSHVLMGWRSDWVRGSLGQLGINDQVLKPFEVQRTDVANSQAKRIALWSKLLPMVMLIWAMTGAFYPAIDMVAGEKERGTLETLLSSPALRGEIVWGKLAAVTTFSMLTAILNTISMLMTGGMVAGQIGLGEAAEMPYSIAIAMLVVLIPLSLMFSAIALGLSALARSSKEGQYYLMPMMMVIVPLVMLPSFPGIRLGIGTSLIPVSGVFLVVQAMFEGQYAIALWHLPIVAAVTIACVGIVVQATMRLFENEEVLFHGGQAFSLNRLWGAVLDNRQPYATTGQAYALAVAILVSLFFGRMLLTTSPNTLGGLVSMVMLPQLGLILLPTLVVAAVCSRRLRTSLRLRWPGWKILLFASALGITLHPTYLLLSQWVAEIYPISDAAKEAIGGLGGRMMDIPWLYLVLLMAVTPAICEELAFRGYVFGGLIRDNQPMRAVLMTAVLFGISHGVLQQSICATMMGVLLGCVAWRTGSVIPTIIIHLISNSLSVSLGHLAEADWAGKTLVFNTTSSGDFVYQPLWSLICLAFSLAILLVISSLPGNPDEQFADKPADTAEPTPPATAVLS